MQKSLILLTFFSILNFNFAVFAQGIPKREPGVIKKASSRITPDGTFNCPVTPTKKNLENIPGVTADKKTYSRDQDSTGWCGDFAFADMVCESLQQKMGKVIPKCSAADLAIAPRPYKPLTDDPKVSPIRKLITEDNFSYIDKLEFINQNGICPESTFPSEFFNNSNHSGYGAELLKLANSLKNNQMTEAKVTLDGLCAECSKQFQEEKDLQELKKIAESANSGNPIDVALIKSINEKVCAGERFGKGIPLKLVPQDGKKGMDPVVQAIARGQPVKVSLNMLDYLDKEVIADLRRKSSQPVDGAHSALIIGGEIGDDGECYFIIKNSYGADCTMYDVKNPLIKCAKTNGLIKIQADVLSDSWYQWLE